MKIINKIFKNKVFNSFWAEQCIISSLIINNLVWERVSEFLKIEDFYFKNHKIIFFYIFKLLNLNIYFDLKILVDEIRLSEKFKLFDYYNYLNLIIQKTPNPYSIYNYAIIVHNASIIRKLFKNINFVFKNSINNNSLKPLLEKLELEFSDINDNYFNRKDNISIVGPILKSVLKKIEFKKDNEDPESLFTGFQELDRILSGIHPGDFIVIAGRPSMGKTTFAINIAQNISLKTNLPIIIFSMEMSSDQLAIRLLSSLSNFDQNLIRNSYINNKDIKKFKKVINKIYSLKIFIDESSSLTPLEIHNKSIKIFKKYGKLGLIIIDYLQLMNSNEINQNRFIEISEISRSLKCLAKNLNVPIIAISQLNRSLESRSDKRPIMSDLRESGAIEQDADVIIFIYRDDVYNKNSKQKGLAEIIISKQRNGPTGFINLSFIGEKLKFIDI